MRFAAEGYPAVGPNLFFKESSQSEIACGEANRKHDSALVIERTAVGIDRLIQEPLASARGREGDHPSVRMPWLFESVLSTSYDFTKNVHFE